MRPGLAIAGGVLLGLVLLGRERKSCACQSGARPDRAQIRANIYSARVSSSEPAGVAG
jgi:hypothetical protein